MSQLRPVSLETWWSELHRQTWAIKQNYSSLSSPQESLWERWLNDSRLSRLTDDSFSFTLNDQSWSTMTLNTFYLLKNFNDFFRINFFLQYCTGKLECCWDVRHLVPLSLTWTRGNTVCSRSPRQPDRASAAPYGPSQSTGGPPHHPEQTHSRQSVTRQHHTLSFMRRCSGFMKTNNSLNH